MIDPQSFVTLNVDFERIVRGHQPAETASALYHYTDAAGLQGIVESKAFWATHFQYTNDATEVIYGISLATKQLERLVAQSHSPKDTDSVREFLGGRLPNRKPSDALVKVAIDTLQEPKIEQKSSYEFFFACFSEHQDQLRIGGKTTSVFGCYNHIRTQAEF